MSGTTTTGTASKGKTLLDAYMYVYDAAVASRSVTIADLADALGVTVPSAYAQAKALESQALIEVADADTVHGAKVTCDDAERLNRAAALAKYRTLVADARTVQAMRSAAAMVGVQHSETTATAPTTSASTPERTPRTRTPRASTPATDKHSAAVVTVLAQRAIDKAHVAVVTTTKGATWNTPAIVEHRDERVQGLCVVSGWGYLHTTSLPISSRAYNHMRKACQQVMHSTDSAVIRHLRTATPEQLEACISVARESLGITVQELSAKAAAKLLAQYMADNS